MNPWRTFILGLLVVPGVVLLAVGPRSDEAIPPGRVVVDYWEKWSGEEEAQMRSIVETYNATEGARKNIYVQLISSGSVDQKVMLTVAAGIPPDIAGLFEINLVQFAAEGALMPLDDLAAARGITASTYKPIFWPNLHWAGHLYALVSTPSVVALHYNKDMFAARAAALRSAGCDPSRPPVSIAELSAYSTALDEFGPDGRLKRVGFLPVEPLWYSDYAYMWFGGHIFDPTSGRFTLTDPAVIAAFTWVQQDAKRWGAAALSEFLGGLGVFDSPTNGFLDGTVAMEQQGPWMATFIDRLKPGFSGLDASGEDDLNLPLNVRQNRCHWAVAPFPASDPNCKDVTYVGFDVLTIPRGARHPKEAFEFMAYLTRQDVMERLSNAHSKPSPLAKVSEHFFQHHRNPYVRVFDQLEASPNAQCPPQVPIMPEVHAELDNVVQQLIQLKATPEQALSVAQQRLQAKYDDWLAKQASRAAESGT